MPEERLVARQTANAELIAEGRKLLTEGRLDEARLVAQSALEANPSDPDAWSLSGDNHERAGDLAQALEAHERVVQLREDSTLDRIRVQHLRQLIAAKALEAPSAPRRGPMIAAAVAAVVLVGSLGAGLALMQTGGVAEPTRTPQNSGLTASNAPQSPPGGFQGTSMNPPPSSPPDPAARLDPAAIRPDPRGPGASAQAMRPNPGGTLPLPSPGGGTVSLGGDRPLPVEPPPNIQVTPERSPGPSPTTGPDPNLDRPEVAQPQGPGRIEIRPSQGGSTTHGGSDTVAVQPSANRAQALVQTARELFRLGNFGQAADAYEKAVEAGANDGATLQRLAQCYERLGRKGDAAGAYDRAIRAYEAELRKSASARAQSGLEACRQALRLLQGA